MSAVHTVHGLDSECSTVVHTIQYMDTVILGPARQGVSVLFRHVGEWSSSVSLSRRVTGTTGVFLSTISSAGSVPVYSLQCRECSCLQSPVQGVFLSTVQGVSLSTVYSAGSVPVYSLQCRECSCLKSTVQGVFLSTVSSAGSVPVYSLQCRKCFLSTVYSAGSVPVYSLQCSKGVFLSTIYSAGSVPV